MPKSISNTYVYDNLLSCVGTGTSVAGLNTSSMALNPIS